MMAKTKDLLELYRSFQSEYFAAIEAIRNNPNKDREAFYKARNQRGSFFGTFDPEKFLKNLQSATDVKLVLEAGEKQKVDKLKKILPLSLKIFSDAETEEDRRASLDKLSDSERAVFENSLNDYADKLFIFNRIKHLFDQKVSNKAYADLDTILPGVFNSSPDWRVETDSQKLADALDKLDVFKLEQAGTRLGEDLAKRTAAQKKINEIPQDIWDNSPNLSLSSIKNYADANRKLYDTIRFDDYETVINNTQTVITNNKEAIDTAARAVKAAQDKKFNVPLWYGQENDPKREELNKLYTGMNNGVFMTAASGMNSATMPTYQQNSRVSGWVMDPKEQPKLSWQKSTLAKDIWGKENIVTDGLDFAFSFVWNPVSWLTIGQLNRLYKNEKNNTQALLKFTQDYFPAQYQDNNFFSARQRRIMEKNPNSLFRTNFKITDFYNGYVKDTYSSPERMSQLAIAIRNKHRGKLNSPEAQKDFQTLRFINETYFADNLKIFGMSLGSSFWTRGAQRIARRVFSKKKFAEKSAVMRRITQAVESGGDYLEHSKKAIDTMKGLRDFFNTKDGSVFQNEKLKKISIALDNLEKAEKITISRPGESDIEGKLIIARNKVFEEIQKANLIGRRSRALVGQMTSIIGKVTDESERQVLLEKVNFIVANVSQPRVEWNHFLVRKLPRIFETKTNVKNRAEHTRMLNAALHQMDYLNKPAYEHALVKFLVKNFPQMAEDSSKMKKIPVPKRLSDYAADPVKRQLDWWERRDLRQYMTHLKEINVFEAFLNKIGVKSEIVTHKNGQKRRMIGLRKEDIGQVGLLYSLAFENAPDVAEKIDAGDKTHVEKVTNKIINSLTDAAYSELEQEALNEGIHHANMPLYIGLKEMEFMGQFGRKFYSDLKISAATSDLEILQKKVENAEAVEEGVKKLMESLRAENGFAYDSGTQFSGEYEELIKKTDEFRNFFKNEFVKKMKEEHPDPKQGAQQQAEAQPNQAGLNEARILQEFNDFTQLTQEDLKELQHEIGLISLISNDADIRFVESSLAEFKKNFDESVDYYSKHLPQNKKVSAELAKLSALVQQTHDMFSQKKEERLKGQTIEQQAADFATFKASLERDLGDKTKEIQKLDVPLTTQFIADKKAKLLTFEGLKNPKIQSDLMALMKSFQAFSDAWETEKMRRQKEEKESEKEKKKAKKDADKSATAAQAASDMQAKIIAAKGQLRELADRLAKLNLKAQSLMAHKESSPIKDLNAIRAEVKQVRIDFDKLKTEAVNFKDSDLNIDIADFQINLEKLMNGELKDFLITSPQPIKPRKYQDALKRATKMLRKHIVNFNPSKDSPEDSK